MPRTNIQRRFNTLIRRKASGSSRVDKPGSCEVFSPGPSGVSSRRSFRSSHQVPLLVALLGALLSSSTASGRSFDWAKVEPIELSFNPAFLKTSLVVADDGEPVRASLVSWEESVGLTFFGDFVVDRHRSDGTLRWSLALEGKAHVQDLAVLSDGSVVLHGSYRDEIHVGGESLLDASGMNRDFLLRLDEMQNIVWLIDYSSIEPNLSRLETVAVDSNDEVWIGASLFTGRSVLRRLDANGATAQEYVQERALSVSSLSFDADGSLWAAGSTSSGTHVFQGEEFVSPFPYALYLVRYDSAGATEWVRFIEDVTGQFPQVVADGEGSAYFAGSLHGDFAFGSLKPEGIDWVFDFFLTKVNSAGDFLWLREVPADTFFGDAGIGRSRLVDVFPGGVVYCGFSRMSVDWDGDGTAAPSWGDRDVLALGFSSDGDLLWEKTAGSVGHDVADAIGVAPDGSVYVAGHAGADAEFDGQISGTEFANNFLAKLVDDTPSAAPDVSVLPPSHVLAFPNPMTDRVRFEMVPAHGDRHPDAGPARGRNEPLAVTVMDVSGRKVRSLSFTLDGEGKLSSQWDGRNHLGEAVPSGTYFLRGEDGEGPTFGKVRVLR